MDNQGTQEKAERTHNKSITSFSKFFQVDNILSRDSLSCACVFNFDVAEVASMAVFLISCEDFAGDTWENPIAEDWGELEGRKLEDTDLYYFEFSVE